MSTDPDSPKGPGDGLRAPFRDPQLDLPLPRQHPTVPSTRFLDNSEVLSSRQTGRQKGRESDLHLAGGSFCFAVPNQPLVD